MKHNILQKVHSAEENSPAAGLSKRPFDKLVAERGKKLQSFLDIFRFFLECFGKGEKQQDSDKKFLYQKRKKYVILSVNVFVQ